MERPISNAPPGVPSAGQLTKEERPKAAVPLLCLSSVEGARITFSMISSCLRLHLQFIPFYYFVFTSCHYCVVLLVKYAHTREFTIFFFHLALAPEPFSVQFLPCRNLRSSEIKSKSEIAVESSEFVRHFVFSREFYRRQFLLRFCGW